MLRLLLLLLSLVGLVACRGNQELHARLESISALMEEHPDSALHLLEELPAHRFRRSRLRADRGLLYTMALDKNYIDSDNDSLIRYTYDYYRRHKATDSVRHLVHYYYGRIRHNDEQYTAAAVEYLEALRLLDTIQSPYRAGLLFSRLGEMYRDQYNFESALGYFYRAHAAYERAKDTIGLYYSKFDMGNTLRSLRRYNESEKSYRQALNLARCMSDNYVMGYCLSNLLSLYYEVDDIAKFKQCYEQLEDLDGYQPTAVYHILVANVSIGENDLPRAKQHLSTAATIGYEGNEPLYYLMQFKLASAERDYEKANYYQYRCINANDSLIRNTYSTSVATAEKQFYAERSAFAEYRLRIRKTAETILAMAIIVLIIVGVGYFRKRIRHKEQQIFDYMAAVDQMQEQYNRLQQTVMKKEQGEDAYKSILAERFSTLDNLCRSFFERDTPHQQQAQLFRELKGRLQALAEDPRMAAELDRVINARFEHLMVRLIEQMPQLSAEDVHFLRLTYAGFSAQVISLVFHDSVQNIYARKYRIKKRIQHSSAVDKMDFINALP